MLARKRKTVENHLFHYETASSDSDSSEIGEFSFSSPSDSSETDADLNEAGDFLRNTTEELVGLETEYGSVNMENIDDDLDDQDIHDDLVIFEEWRGNMVTETHTEAHVKSWTSFLIALLVGFIGAWVASLITPKN